jgi:predicted Zn-dependent peptidase
MDEKKVLRLVEKYFGDLGTRDIKRQFKSQVFELDQTKPQIKLRTRKGEQTHIILGFASEGRTYKGKFIQGLLSVVLGGNMSSRMFIEVRERRGLAYAVRTNMTRYQEVGYLGTYAGVDVAKVEEAAKVILDQCYGLASKRYPVGEKELAKAKGFLKGNLALTLENTRDVNEFFGTQELFLPKVLTPEEIYQKIDAVTLDDIYFEAKKLFAPERLNLAVIGPYSDSKKLEELLK